MFLSIADTAVSDVLLTVLSSKACGKLKGN